MATLQKEHSQLQQDLKSHKETTKKLTYENEKLFSEIQAFKKQHTQTQALSEETWRKKVKRITGELDMFDTYVQTISLLIESIAGKNRSYKSDLSKVTGSLNQTVTYLRDICQDTGLNVSQQKRNQRQLRYERLREEFT